LISIKKGRAVQQEESSDDEEEVEIQRKRKDDTDCRNSDFDRNLKERKERNYSIDYIKKHK
jgi:hypothetical protein